MSVESARASDLRIDAAALLGAVWGRALRIALVTALLLVATWAVLLFVPKLYESSASLLVEDRTSVYTQPAGTTASSGSSVSAEAKISSQIELIKSRDTLLAVIESEGLRKVPEFAGGGGINPIGLVMRLLGRGSDSQTSDETILQILNERLTVIRERDSAVISIYVRAEDPQLAARLANAIAAEHVRRRAAQAIDDTAEATTWLAQQIDTLSQKVKEADTAVANYRVENDIFEGANNTSLSDQQLSDIQKQITDAQERKNTAQQRANLIRGLLKAGKPIDSVPDVRDSPIIQQFTQTRAELQGQLAQSSATLLASHPTIKALQAQLTQIDAQIATEAKRIADGLEGQVTIETGTIASLNDDLARAKIAASTQTRDSVGLDSLEREAKAQRDLLESYLLKYRDAASRTDAGSALPDVRVITQAAPSVTPASPKTALSLAAVAFAALALQIGAVLFAELMSGRAVYDRSMSVDEFETDDAEPEEIEASVTPPIRRHATVELPVIVPDLVTPSRRSSAQRSAPSTAVPAQRHVDAAEAELELSNLSADIAVGRVRIVLLAATSKARDAAAVADRLADDALRNGLSVCRIDAGSMRPTGELGLTDLCADEAGFGDVVHKVSDGLAEVPWGHRATLERRSMKPVTLIEALSDIYEVVIVSTGRTGLGSSLPVFSGVNGRLVFVNPTGLPADREPLLADAAALGFEPPQSVFAPQPQHAVA